MNNLIYKLTGPWACTVYILLGIFTYSEFSTAKTYVEWKSQTKFQKENVVSEELSFAIYEYMCQEGLIPYEVCNNGDPSELIDEFLEDNVAKLPSISKYDEWLTKLHG